MRISRPTGAANLEETDVGRDFCNGSFSDIAGFSGRVRFTLSTVDLGSAFPDVSNVPLAEVVRSSGGLRRQLVQQCFGTFQVERVKAFLGRAVYEARRS